MCWQNWLAGTEPQRGFEGVEGRHLSWVEFHGIPVLDCPWKEGSGVGVGLAWGDTKPLTVSPCDGRIFSHEMSPVQINQAVANPVHHSEAILQSSLCKRNPSKIVDCCCYTLGLVVHVGYKASRATLYLFNFLNVLLSVGVPGRCGEFNNWSDVCCIACFLDLSSAFPEVSWEEGPRLVSFLCSSRYVSVEVELRVNMNT